MSFAPSFLKRFYTKTTRFESTPNTQEKHKITTSASTPSLNMNDKREAQISEILSQQVIDLDKIRSMAWAGIPNKFRAEVWRLFLDYEPVHKDIRHSTLEHKRDDYFDCLNRVYSEPQRRLWTNAQKGTVQQILRDLPRTSVPLLRNKNVQKMFERVLFVWSVRHPASGYVQGMNDLLQPFFFAFLVPYCGMKDPVEISKQENINDLSEEALRNVEADSFWCFSKLLDGLQDLFTKDQPGLYKMLENLKNVVDKVNPELAKHIESEDIQYQEFAFRWMNCLLVREFSVHNIFRIWDNYLSHNNTIATTHVYICAALMESMAVKLMQLSHADFVMEMQGITPDVWKPEDIEEILAQSYVYEKMFSKTTTHIRSSSMPALNKK